MTNVSDMVEIAKREYGVPEHCAYSLCNYFWGDNRPLGGFITAVLENDLCKASLKADDTNYKRLRNYARFIYNVAPDNAWGSPEKVKAWLERGGDESQAT